MLCNSTHAGAAAALPALAPSTNCSPASQSKATPSPRPAWLRITQPTPSAQGTASSASVRCATGATWNWPLPESAPSAACTAHSAAPSSAQRDKAGLEPGPSCSWTTNRQLSASINRPPSRLPSNTPAAREPGVTMPSTDKPSASTSKASARRPAAGRRGVRAKLSTARVSTSSNTAVAAPRCVARTSASTPGAPSSVGATAAAAGRSAPRQPGQSTQAGRGCARRSQALAVVTTSISSRQAQASRRSVRRRRSSRGRRSSVIGRRLRDSS